MQTATRTTVTLRFVDDTWSVNDSPEKGKADWKDIQEETEYTLPDHAGGGTYKVTIQDDKPVLVRGENASPLALPKGGGKKTWLFTAKGIWNTRKMGGKTQKGDEGVTMLLVKLLAKRRKKR